MDYNNYKMSLKEYLFYISISSIVLFGIGYTFYRNIFIAVAISILSVLFIKYKKQDLVKKRKEMLNLQFRDMLYVISASLSAGRSVELAFNTLADDLSIEYKDPEDFIIKEAIYIKRRISVNESLENILRDFAKRSGLEDIKNFVNVFVTCKKTGGNMVSAINETSKTISEKIKICNDINTTISARKLEIIVLNIMPFLLVITISFMSQDYFEPLYNTSMGRIVTTISLGLLGISNYLSYRIMNIRV